MRSIGLLSGARTRIEAAVREAPFPFKIRAIQIDIPQNIAIRCGIHIDPRREEEAVNHDSHDGAMHED
jgi:hypothetical protein